MTVGGADSTGWGFFEVDVVALNSADDAVVVMQMALMPVVSTVGAMYIDCEFKASSGQGSSAHVEAGLNYSAHLMACARALFCISR